ncbi:hypothetical protein M877_24090 [Streptomyces niveus NCIMB 11891]|nr:hypothetical protein M877_24090 [Streptomyces niveus NCIMB 11891]
MQDVVLRREIDYRRLAEFEVREDGLPTSVASDVASGLSDEGLQGGVVQHCVPADTMKRGD